MFVGLPHNDRHVEAIPRIVHRNILLLDVGRRTGRVRIQQVPELRVVEQQLAVVADGRVSLDARAEALFPRGHPFFLFACVRGSVQYVGASFYALTALT